MKGTYIEIYPHREGLAFGRFVAKIRSKRSGCWEWRGWIDKDGYGRMYFGARFTKMAHRVSWEWAHGPIPDAMTLDHLCRNRACVNPRHLEVVTRGENVMRGLGAAADNARKQTCKRGHRFDAVERCGKRTQRRCRTCKREARQRPT